MVQSPADALWAGVRRENTVAFIDICLDDGAEELEERLLFEVFARACPQTAENFRLLCTGERNDTAATGPKLHYEGCQLWRTSLGKIYQPLADLESTEPETTDIIYMDEQPVIDSATYSLPVKAMNDQAKLKQALDKAPGNTVAAAIDCIQGGVLTWNNALPSWDENGKCEGARQKGEQPLDCQFSAFGSPFQMENGCSKYDSTGLLVAIPNNQGLCSSCFAITLQSCSAMEEKPCVFGRLLAGHGFLKHLDNSTRSGSARKLMITRCGQVDRGHDGKMVDCDGDPFPAFPEDSALWLPQRAVPTRLSVALQIKEFGNEAFQDQAFVTAARKYRKALRYLQVEQRWMREDPVAATEAATHLRPAHMPLLLNLAAAHLKLGRGRDAIDALNEHQDLEARCAQSGGSMQRLKALYRRGLAYCQVHEFEAAIKDLERALALAMAGHAAQAPAIRHELSKARMRSEARCRRARAAMFQAISSRDAGSGDDESTTTTTTRTPIETTS